ncbi:Hypp1630 [Branchiostoma lanceolatum]|uniref:Hypp1630 protein n=1 Tax=Branchiostoma lanceolatum TaxID=7740 RepID=A0A8K0ELK2_BRALA|nr:Hypp1630 [Branchiostoma lanceolatum]
MSNQTFPSVGRSLPGSEGLKLGTWGPGDRRRRSTRRPGLTTFPTTQSNQTFPSPGRSLPGSEGGMKLVEARHSGAWRPPAQVYTPPWPHHIPYNV